MKIYSIIYVMFILCFSYRNHQTNVINITVNNWDWLIPSETTKVVLIAVTETGVYMGA